MGKGWGWIIFIFGLIVLAFPFFPISSNINSNYLDFINKADDFGAYGLFIALAGLLIVFFSKSKYPRIR